MAGAARERQQGGLLGSRAKNGTLVAVVKAMGTVLGGEVLLPWLLWRGHGVEDQMPATPFLTIS